MASILEGVFTMSHTIDLTKTTFMAYITPPFLCQYLIGVLVQLEGTRPYRLTLLPVLVWLAWRATLVDMSGGNPANVQANTMLGTQLLSMVTRSSVWAFARVRYQRHSPTVDYQNKSDSGNLYTACWNTWDLLMNPRGIGWNWPRGLVVPKPAFETNSRVTFLLLVAAGVVFHGLAFDASVQIIRVLSPETFGSLDGGSLFDGSLPLVLELVRAVLISTLGAASAYFGLQYVYQILAIVFVITFHQHPSQWPPLFDAPWMSSSLSDLWGRRWHQLMRDMLLTLGGQPFGYVFGRLGGVLGVFLVSGIFHVFELRSAGRGGSALVICGFWVMNGVGIILERVWKKVTGRTVGGWWGRMWVAGWLLLWGVPWVNEYAKAGRFAALGVPGRFEPSLALVALFRRG